MLARSRVRRSVGAEPDVLQATVHKLAYKQLGPGEWKRLAYHWTFTDDQIQAIEHQYTGPASYKEHGYRMFQIWVYGLEQGASPVRELCDALVAIDRKSVAGNSTQCTDLII